jgi:hypothetical protein
MDEIKSRPQGRTVAPEAAYWGWAEIAILARGTTLQVLRLEHHL